MLGSFLLNQLQHTPEISFMLSLHFGQSFGIMALIVFNASCFAKWPWCEVLDVAREACWEEEMMPGLHLALRHLKVVLAGWPGQCETRPKCSAALLM